MRNLLKLKFRLITGCNKKQRIKFVSFTVGIGLTILILNSRYFQKDKIARDRAWFFSVVPDNLSSYPVTSESTCNCKRSQFQSPSSSESSSSGANDAGNLIESTCDTYASQRGYHQKVVSYAFYGLITNNYFRGIVKNVEKVAELYPGWIVRLYHGVDTSQPSNLAALCDIWCNYPDVDICQVGVLPKPLGDISRIHGMVWRFMVLGDPLIEQFVIRDLDSLPSEREVAAVNEWLASNRTWHIMHDHPAHDIAVLGGMWGGINNDLNLMTSLRENLLKEANVSYSTGYDQDLLTKYLYPIALETSDYIDHNSYLCTKYFHSVPWPTQRNEDKNFVGSPSVLFNSSVPKPCPQKCRPKNHPDWTYC